MLFRKEKPAAMQDPGRLIVPTGQRPADFSQEDDTMTPMKIIRTSVSSLSNGVSNFLKTRRTPIKAKGAHEEDVV